MPWKEDMAVVDVGLCSRLSSAATVKILYRRLLGQTISALARALSAVACA